MRATRSGNQLAQSAHERIIKRNPTASTKERRITVLRPAAMGALSVLCKVLLAGGCTDFDTNNYLRCRNGVPQGTC